MNNLPCMKNQGLSRGESKTRRNAAQIALGDTSHDGARAATPGTKPSCPWNR